MLSTFRFILVGARDYRPIFEDLGGKNVRYIGSLKFGAKALPVDGDALKALQESVGNRMCIGFICTHNTEEAMFADIFHELKKEFPKLLAIVAPRHATRGNEIADMLASKNLAVAIRSKQQKIVDDTDVYLADTTGELGLCYALCPLAIIGGSFIPHGGQNPIEGTHFGTAILYGPHMFNFPELCAALEHAGAAEMATDKDDLTKKIFAILRKPELLENMRTAAKQLSTQNIDVIDAFTEEIIRGIIEK